MPKFLRQDYHTYKRLKHKWRRPKGHQSKLRVNKGGSGVRPRIGFGSKGEAIPVVRNASELGPHKTVLLASQLGSKKAGEIAKRAGELGITILNKRKLKRYERISKNLEKRRLGRKKAEVPKQTEEPIAQTKENNV